MNSSLCHCLRCPNAFHRIVKSSRRFTSVHASLAKDILQKCKKQKIFFTPEQFGCVFIKNFDLANSIASKIVGEWNGGYLLQANAGPGILSSSLLQNGIKHLRVFEKKQEFVAILEVLSTEFPSLDIVHNDLMLLPSLEFKKRSESNNADVNKFYEQTFRDIPTYPWENGKVTLS